MKTEINMRSFALNIIEYLFVIILVLNCNSIWTSCVGTSLNKVLKALIVVSVIFYIFIQRKISSNEGYRILFVGGLCALYYAVYAIAVNYQDSTFLYFVVDTFFIFIFVRLATYNKRIPDVLYKYENIVIIIAVVSLLFWFFGSILGLLQPTGYVYSTWTGNNKLKTVQTYYNLYFETQTLLGITRNTAIFTEAPMYNFHLCIALLIDMFYKRKASKARCCILITAVLTTISTTGWCMLIIALFLKYIFNNHIKGFWKIIRLFIVPMALVAGLIAVQTLVLNKLETGSGSARVDDFAAGFKAWRVNPIFGVGYENNEYVKRFMSSFRLNNTGFSNSPMQIMYQGGIMLAIPYIFCAFKWIETCIKNKDINYFLFFVGFISLFTITIVSYRFLTVFMFFIYDAHRAADEIGDCPRMRG